TAEQRQRSSVNIRARAVVTLLVTKRHILVPLVLNVAREEIAVITTRAKASRVTSRDLIATVIKVSGPTGVPRFRIRIEYARQRKSELNKSALCAYRPLRRHHGNTILQSENDCRGAIDRNRRRGVCQSRSVIKV